MSGRPGCSRTPSARVTACGTSSPSVSGASSVSHTPSGYDITKSLATSRARRVLPGSPAPVSVNRRVIASCRLTSTNSRSRPTKLVLGDGQVVLASVRRFTLRWAGRAGAAGIRRQLCLHEAVGLWQRAGRASSRESASRSRSYCCKAALRRPEKAYKRMSPACASSRVGSSEITLS